MAKSVVVNFIGDTSRLSRATNEANSKLQAVGDKAKAAGRKLTLGVTLPLIGAGVAAFKFASDQNEALSKVNVVFGKSARAVESWADRSAEAFGLSKAEALDAVGTIGNLFTALKLPQQEATKMSQKVVELAGDLASFNNVSVDEALTALRSGLVGETEPLKRFGVNLNEATLKEQALRMGLVKTTKGPLPAAVKAQAAYALILQQTKTAQGDYARTADGAANRQRTLVAQFKNAAATLGTRLMPIGQKLLGWVSKLFEWFGKLTPKMQTFILIGAGIAAAIGPAISVVGALAGALAALASPIGIAAAAVALLVVGFVKAWRESEAFRDKIRDIVEKVKGFVDGLVERFRAMAPFFKSVWEGMLKTGKAVVAALSKVIGGLIEKWGPFFQKFLPVVARVLGEAFKIAGAIIRNVLPILRGVINVSSAIMSTFISLVARVVNAVIRVINAVIRGINLIKPGKDIGTLKTIDVSGLFAADKKVSAQVVPASKLEHLQHGGTVTKTGLAQVHKGETFSGTGIRAQGAGGNVNIIVQGSIITERQLVERVRSELLKIGKANPGVGLA